MAERGGKSRLTAGALGVLCLIATIFVAAPSPAFAASGVGEYNLNLPDGGSGGSSGEGGESSTTPAPVPTAPAYPTTTYPTTPTETTVIGGGGPKKKKPSEEELAPALASSSANAELGPKEIPALRVADDGDGPPLGGILLALLAAACCLLAIWRLRVLRELPVSPHRRATRGAA